MIPSLAAFMAGGGALPIEVISALANTGALFDGLGGLGSFNVSPGSNRLLAVVQHLSGSTDTISALTWGGEDMALRFSQTSGGGFPTIVKLWTLGEAGIAAASGTAFGLTGGTNGSYRATAVALANVDQVNPVVDFGGGIRSGADPADVVLSTVEGGYAIAGVMFDFSTDSDINWAAPFNKRVEGVTSATGNSFASADTLTDGTNLTSDVTTDEGGPQQCQAAISFRPA